MKKTSDSLETRPRQKSFRVRYRALNRRDFLELGGVSALAGVVGCVIGEGEVDPSADAGAWQEATHADTLPHISPITSNDDHYETSYFGMADVDSTEWECQVFSGELLLGVIDYEFLLSLDYREKEHTLQCIESRPSLQKMSNAVW